MQLIPALFWPGIPCHEIRPSHIGFILIRFGYALALFRYILGHALVLLYSVLVTPLISFRAILLLVSSFGLCLGSTLLRVGYALVVFGLRAGFFPSHEPSCSRFVPFGLRLNSVLLCFGYAWVTCCSMLGPYEGQPFVPMLNSAGRAYHWING